jgi:thaumarchaeosortase
VQTEEEGKLQRAHGSYILLRKTLPVLSLAVPLASLYFLYPESFEATWIGRTYYLFFMWILFLETFLVSEDLDGRISRLQPLRGLGLLVALPLPTLYVLAANHYGLSTMIENLTAQAGVAYSNFMPISLEFIVLMVFFAVIVILNYGVPGLKHFAVSSVFLGAIGVIYIINNLYPYGQFTPFQMIVPTTANLAMGVLNLMGYRTIFLGDYSSNTPVFVATDASNRSSAAYAIAWPCSGVESLIIYAITGLLFLRKMPMSHIVRILFFAIGALVTYFINILRIATIFVISIQGGNVAAFHDYYGQLYSIVWIISYPLILVGLHSMWGRIQTRRLKKHVGTEQMDEFLSSST